MLISQIQRKIRHRRVRARVQGSAQRPRLSVFRSNGYIYAQLIDDGIGNVLCSARGNKSVKEAEQVGRDIAKKAIAKKIDQAVFDRGGYKYHGRIKALADGARAGGLKF